MRRTMEQSNRLVQSPNIDASPTISAHPCHQALPILAAPAAAAALRPHFAHCRDVVHCVPVLCNPYSCISLHCVCLSSASCVHLSRARTWSHSPLQVLLPL